jgi:hypothetical protein
MTEEECAEKEESWIDVLLKLQDEKINNIIPSILSPVSDGVLRTAYALRAGRRFKNKSQELKNKPEPRGGVLNPTE